MTISEIDTEITKNKWELHEWKRTKIESTVSGARDKIDNFCWFFPSIYFLFVSPTTSLSTTFVQSHSAHPRPREICEARHKFVCVAWKKMTSCAGCSEKFFRFGKVSWKFWEKGGIFREKIFLSKKNAECKIKKEVTRGEKCEAWRKWKKKLHESLKI